MQKSRKGRRNLKNYPLRDYRMYVVRSERTSYMVAHRDYKYIVNVRQEYIHVNVAMSYNISLSRLYILCIHLNNCTRQETRDLSSTRRENHADVQSRVSA